MKNPKCVFCPIVNCESYAEFPDEVFNKCKKETGLEIKRISISDKVAEKNNYDTIDALISTPVNNKTHLEKPKENTEDIILITELKQNSEIKTDNDLKIGYANSSSYITKSNNESYNRDDSDNNHPPQFDKFKLNTLLKSQKIILVCKENQHAFCNLCRKYAHGDSDCGKKLEEEYAKIAKKSKHIRKCPRCDFYIEKNEGCNHMTCYNRECNFQFCWICMGEYTSNTHYNNPLSPCFGLQYLNQNNVIVKCPCLLYLKLFFFIILALIAIPIGLALAPLAMPTFIWLSFFLDDYLNFSLSSASGFYVIIGFCTNFFLGIALLPVSILIYAVSICFLLLFGIARMFYECCIKR